MEGNPEVIQEGDGMSGNREIQATPVFLIHDGGGTTFAYHCLDRLDRPTYGIFNPLFRSGGRFEGGVCGMGRLYAGVIKRTCSEQDFPSQRTTDGAISILLGGWSMGGLLSLEISKVLSNDRDVKVIGILMMDSVYPVNLPTGHVETLGHFDLDKSRNMFLSLQAMKEALRVICEWHPPVWDGNEASQRPHISLLRAVDSLPTSSGRTHLIDAYRHEKALGWDSYEVDMFAEIVNVKGNHFDMFSFQHIPEISITIKRCFDILERLDRGLE